MVYKEVEVGWCEFIQYTLEKEWDMADCWRFQYNNAKMERKVPMTVHLLNKENKAVLGSIYNSLGRNFAHLARNTFFLWHASIYTLVVTCTWVQADDFQKVVHVFTVYSWPLSNPVYYMATIVRTLWLAAERALFSCNDRALWNFFSARQLFWVVSKTRWTWQKQRKRWTKVQLYFQYLKEKLAFRYFFSMSDEESRSARKQMRKIPVFLLYSL